MRTACPDECRGDHERFSFIPEVDHSSRKGFSLPSNSQIQTMKRLLQFIALLSPISAIGQYIWIESAVTCDKKKLEVIRDAQSKFKPILNELTKGGLIINWVVADEMVVDKNIIFTWHFATPSRQSYDAAMSQFKKKASAAYPQLWQSYSEACPSRKDTTIMTGLLYPIAKSDIYTVVGQVENITESPDPTLAYNIVVDFTGFSSKGKTKEKIDSSQVNWAITDVGRVYNLHVASGIPKEKINMVVAVHGSATDSFLTNEAYRKKYTIDNPNLVLIKELKGIGVRFLVCGQSLRWTNTDRKSILPEIGVTLTAQTTLTSYQLKGYALIKMEND
jgi:intracellular sulfur oxidation DsrE/DsrF family protein